MTTHTTTSTKPKRRRQTAAERDALMIKIFEDMLAAMARMPPGTTALEAMQLEAAVVAAAQVHGIPPGTDDVYSWMKSAHPNEVAAIEAAVLNPQ